MPHNLKSLIEQAAQLRSAGASWDSVARKVGRRATTCRNWPQKHAAVWKRFYREACGARCEELGNEAQSRLRVLLHDEDKKYQIKSAEVLLRHRVVPPTDEESIYPNDGELRMTDEEWHKHRHDSDMDDWRSSRGLPPYRDQQERLGEIKAFYEHRDAEALETYKYLFGVDVARKAYAERQARNAAHAGTSESDGYAPTDAQANSPPARTAGEANLQMPAVVGAIALLLGIFVGKTLREPADARLQAAAPCASSAC